MAEDKPETPHMLGSDAFFEDSSAWGTDTYFNSLEMSEGDEMTHATTILTEGFELLQSIQITKGSKQVSYIALLNSGLLTHDEQSTARNLSDAEVDEFIASFKSRADKRLSSLATVLTNNNHPLGVPFTLLSGLLNGRKIEDIIGLFTNSSLDLAKLAAKVAAVSDTNGFSVTMVNPDSNNTMVFSEDKHSDKGYKAQTYTGGHNEIRETILASTTPFEMADNMLGAA